MSYEFLDHTADVAFRISAGNPEELFQEAAGAFYAVLLSEGSPGRIEPREERTIELDGIDAEMLLVDFLNELLYRFDTERLLLPHVRVEEVRPGGGGAGGARLLARVRGERLDPARHEIRTAIKAATYHGLRIEEAGGRFIAEVVLDL